MVRRFILAVALLAIASRSAADVLETRDGRTLRGRVLNRREIVRSPALVSEILLLPQGPGQPVVRVPREEVSDLILEHAGISTVYHLAPVSADRRLDGSGWRRVSSLPTWGWIAITASSSRYAMEALDGRLDELNAGLATARFDHVTAGAGFGLAGGTRFGPGRDVGVGYERILGSTEASDATARIEYDVPANLYRVSGTFGWPLLGRGAAGIGAGVGLVRPVASYRFTDADGRASDRVRIRGTGFLAEGVVFAEARILEPWSMQVATGYRQARVTNVSVEGIPAIDLDYSGAFVRVALLAVFGGD